MSGFSKVRFAVLTAILAAMLFGCAQQPDSADPALWRIESPNGQVGWLFGTIHNADSPLAWRTKAVGEALDGSRIIMVEVGNLADEAAVSATFSRLARSHGEQPPLTERVPPEVRPQLKAMLAKAGYRDGDFAQMDTWAAALTLAQTGQKPEESRNGVDRAVIAAARGRPVLELEGAARQLELFEHLPEREQSDLLCAVVREIDSKDADLTESWRKGDMTAIEAETRKGLLADPELRLVLFTNRNRDWTARIGAAVQAGKRPFVAVGAAHMAGPQGLPAMLGAQGFTITRVE